MRNMTKLLTILLLLTPAGLRLAAQPQSLSGNTVLYADTRDGQTTIWQTDLNNLAARSAILHLSHLAGWSPEFSLSPDAQHVAYVTPKFVGSNGIAVGTLEVLDLQTGRTTTLDDSVDLWAPKWDRLSRDILYKSDRAAQLPDRSVYQTISLDGGPPVPILAGDPSLLLLGWAQTGRSLLYYQIRDRTGTFGLYNLQTAQARELGALPGFLAVDISLSPQSERILYRRISITDPGLQVVAYFSPETRSETILGRVQGDVFNPIFAGNSRAVIASVYKDAAGSSSAVVFEINQAGVTEKISTPTERSFGGDPKTQVAHSIDITLSDSPFAPFRFIVTRDGIKADRNALLNTQTTQRTEIVSSGNVSFIGWTSSSI